MEVGLLYGGVGSAAIAVRDLGHVISWNYEPRGDHFLLTFSANFPEAQYYNNFQELEKAGSVNIVIGQPDCKEYSSLRTRITEKSKFHKTGLWDFIWKVQVLEPEAFILENLPRGIEALKEYLQKRADLDFNLTVNPWNEQLMLYGWQTINENYRLYFYEINANNFIAQNRKRSFVIGIHSDFTKKFNLILPGNKEQRRVKDLLRTLEDKESTKIVKNHKFPNHSLERIKRFDELRPGESYYGTQNNRRLNPNKSAYAITSHCTQHVHYKFPRVLTVRECARIQGFPDDFVFTGSKTHQYDQVGKAISVPVIKYILEQVISYLSSFNF